MYVRLDTRKSGLHSFPITRSWKEVTQGVDAVFAYDDKMYMIKVDFKVTIRTCVRARVCVEVNTNIRPALLTPCRMTTFTSTKRRLTTC